MRRTGTEKKELQEEDKFYWHKKRQLEGSTGLSSRELSALEAERREHNRQELERIRRQREEREILAAKRMEEKEKSVRERERENLGDWEEKERLFHLSQAYQKVYLRIRENRARNIHLLSLVTQRISLLVGKEVFKGEEVILLADEEISTILSKFDCEQVNDALDELEDLFLPYERDSRVLKFWAAFKSLTGQLKESTSSSGSSALKDNRNIALVKDEVNAIFRDKTVLKLLELRDGIQKKLKSPNVDTDYWSGLLKELDQVILRRQLDELYKELKDHVINESKSKGFRVNMYSFSQFKHGEVRFSDVVCTEEEQTSKKRSKSLETIEDEPLPLPFTETSHVDNSPAALHLYEQEQTRNVGKDELPFNAEADDLFCLSTSAAAWTTIYPQIRARKPRFFNRVRMNYVWNKYNQTHYDTSNPPPKVVQGFRFNIFYPELQAKDSAVPNYKREADPTSEDNEIIRFFAGPPYSDLIFRIPKEEWDMSSQHGFKCIFERGALRLHFWFRSQRYRR